jgi:ankyrin repeat protein
LGLQNAFHIAVVCPTNELIDFLVALKIEADEPDYD